MANNQKNHEIGTLLRLIAPEAVEVELVPLASIEKAEFLFFWATIFLTVWGTVLGTWLSLITVKYDNPPVVNILLAVLAFLSLLVLVFTWSGFSVRRRTRQSARLTAAQPRKLPMPDRMDNVIVKLIEMLTPEFTEADFKRLVDRFDNNGNDVALQAVLFDRLVATGKAEAVEGTSDPIKYRSTNVQSAKSADDA
jgi:hypothetical protein